MRLKMQAEIWRRERLAALQIWKKRVGRALMRVTSQRVALKKLEKRATGEIKKARAESRSLKAKLAALKKGILLWYCVL